MGYGHENKQDIAILLTSLYRNKFSFSLYINDLKNIFSLKIHIDLFVDIKIYFSNASKKVSIIIRCI